MPVDWTVQRMLGWMAQDFASLGMPSPRLDAELLLSHALGCDRVRLYMDMQRPLESAEREAVRALVIRRRRHEPVAYILGRKEFYRRSLEVTRDVLVPRPDTEILVDRALDATPHAAERALDLCTGSGAVALTLALERPGLIVDATDVSPAALAVAARNAASLALTERVNFYAGDLFAALPEPRLYDLIVANPPYVADGEWPTLARDIVDHEPRIAFVAGHDGLDVLRRLCAQAADWLRPGGGMLLEVGHTQAREVGSWLQADPRFEAVTIHKDFGGVERVVESRRVAKLDPPPR
jgi:release factor glutamine methyltransferase